jgi:hypothetical protein
MLALAGALMLACALLASAPAAAAKEFADCGSTTLLPVKLELEPDPAEVSDAPAGGNTPPNSHPTGA